jgi:pyruvate kinase
MKFTSNTISLVLTLVASAATTASAFAPQQPFLRSKSYNSNNLAMMIMDRRSALFASTVAPTTSSSSSSSSSSSMPQSSVSVAAVPKVAQRWRKSTKQVVTLGPASSSKEMIETLFLAGADVFRLNFSHGSQEQKKDLLLAIREIEEKYSHPIGILGDLQGPKLRVRLMNDALQYI